MPAFAVKSLLLRRSILPIVGVLAAVTLSCSDSVFSGGRTLARIALQPQFSKHDAEIYYSLKDFGLAVTSLRVVLVRPGTTDTVAQTTVNVEEGQNEIVVSLDAPIRGSEERLTASLEMSSGGVLLFSGSVSLIARVAADIARAPVLVPLWVGPGKEAVRIAISPRDVTLPAGGRVTFGATAFDANNNPVTSTDFQSRWQWRLDDPTLGSIPLNGGEFVGGSKAGVALITVFTPNLLRDTVRLTLVGAPTQLNIVSGNNQTAVAGAALPQPFVVEVLSSNNSPVPNTAVTFSVLSGGGGGDISPRSTLTNAQGRAQAAITLGPVATVQQFRALVTGLAPAVLSATAIAGAAATMVLQAGNEQSVVAGSPLPVKPAVKVADARGNPVAGVAVTFSVTGGGGSVIGGDATTGTDGVATVGTWTLGTSLGTNTLTASASGLAGSPVTFIATSLAGSAGILTTAGGDNQIAVAGTSVAANPSVKVTDVIGNAVAGVSVTFEVTTGGGTITGGVKTTGADGIAAVDSWTLGAKAGINQLLARATGLVGSPVTFAAVGRAGPASAIVSSAGDNQSVVAGAAVSISPAVLVTDANGNPVAGVPVTFAVASGGGAIAAASQTTRVDGIAAVGSWTLGTSPGTNTLTASAPGLSGSPVTFTAIGLSTNVPVRIAFERQLEVADRGATLTTRAVVTNSTGSQLTGVGVTYESRTPTIASVSESGVITGAAKGQAVITATVSSDPSLIDSLLVVVAEPGAPVLISSIDRFEYPRDATLTVSVFVDMRSSTTKLGSTTIDVQWNPAQLLFQSSANGASGVIPTVNLLNTSTGSLTLAMADVVGFGGRVELLRLTFRTSSSASIGQLALTAREMAAADINLTNLLPSIVQVVHSISVR